MLKKEKGVGTLCSLYYEIIEAIESTLGLIPIMTTTNAITFAVIAMVDIDENVREK